MNQNFMCYGVFINGEYSEHPDFATACDYFDSAVALGQVEEGSVIGWYSLEDYQTLYTCTDVVECELHSKLPEPKSSDPGMEPIGLA